MNYLFGSTLFAMTDFDQFQLKQRLNLSLLAFASDRYDDSI